MPVDDERRLIILPTTPGLIFTKRSFKVVGSGNMRLPDGLRSAAGHWPAAASY
jgi:hypothetical protein